MRLLMAGLPDWTPWLSSPVTLGGWIDSTPIPEDEGALGFDLSDITAKTLLLFGAKDPLTGSRHGTWWQRRLPDARLEMSPQGGHDLLAPTWKRTRSHLAPHCKR
jgi:pimeloyl-ACP methyl ester carboxylesterase